MTSVATEAQKVSSTKRVGKGRQRLTRSRSARGDRSAVDRERPDRDSECEELQARSQRLPALEPLEDIGQGNLVIGYSPRGGLPWR